MLESMEYKGLWEDSISRVLAKDVVAKLDVPSFRRSTVDGYAVKTTDLSGASESVPTFLKIVGESKMGRTCDICINGGECVYVPTGGMLPYGSDAIIMEEWVENFTDDKISVYKSIASGENVVDVGEDNKKCDQGELVVTSIASTMEKEDKVYFVTEGYSYTDYEIYYNAY